MAQPQGSNERATVTLAEGRHGAVEAADGRLLDTLFELASRQLAAEAELPATTGRPPDELVRELGIALGEEGRSFEEVAARLGRLLAATPSSASPRFFNQLFGGRDDIAVLAEMLTPLVNSSMYTYKVAGPQVLVEREVLARMAAKVGWTEGEGALVPGGSLANLTALLVARNEAVERAREDGLDGRPLAIYTSADGHYSIGKNAGILGLGRRSVRRIATDRHGRMRPDELRRAIAADRAAGRRPLAINATAGTTVVGAFDPLRELAAVARQEELWLHVDGALGGSVVLSRRHRRLVDGAELADSFAWNAHKMMGVPLSCSALLFRRRGLMARHLGESADYLFQSSADGLDPGKQSLQCGRRNDALKLWAAWQLHGDLGYAERIDRLFELARYAARRIAADPALELVLEPPSINVCFEVRGKPSDAVCARLENERRLLIGHGRVGDRRAIRLVCVNPDLAEPDLDAVLDEVKRAAAGVAAGGGARR